MTTLEEFWTHTKDTARRSAAADRHARIARMVREGMTDGQMAVHLGVSVRTVLRDRKDAGIPSGVPSGHKPGSGAKCTVCGLLSMTTVCRGCKKKQQNKNAAPKPPAEPVLTTPRQPDPVRASAWQEDALCAQTDPEAFFPEKGGSTRYAKRVCAACPVRAACLEDALGDPEDRFGIRGGLSERQRRKARRERAAAAAVEQPDEEASAA